MTKPNFSPQPFHDPAACQALLERLDQALTSPFSFMEVCGTHTSAILRSGLASLLPDRLRHISGPGCPVCVTHQDEIAAGLALAGQDQVIIATFGDLMRVPGPDGQSLKDAASLGARVRLVYSPMEAVSLARDNPGDRVVFLGIGFETTAPAVALAMKTARSEGLDNFLVLSMHKRITPALRLLLADPDQAIDAFMLPGHVSAVIGLAPYRFMAEEFSRTGVVAGFEPLDILSALILMLEYAKRPGIFNTYGRIVAEQGNPTALAILDEVFAPADARWRGLGLIPDSGLQPRGDYRKFDAREVLGLSMPVTEEHKACRCGLILRGRIAPQDCPAFAKACTPARPLGPCMVSSEGACHLHFNYSPTGGY